MSPRHDDNAPTPDAFFKHPFRGVFAVIEGGDSSSARWLAMLRHDGRRVKLGNFVSPLVAAIAHDLALMNLGLPPVNISEPQYRSAIRPHALEAGLQAVRSPLGLFEGAEPPTYRQP